MISDTDANEIDEWLRKFQKEHDDLKIVDDKAIKSLACALHDDIPFGNEASIRLANWLFCHLNVPKISGKLLKNVQHMAEHQKDAEERLNEAFDDYKRYTRDLMMTFEVLKEAE